MLIVISWQKKRREPVTASWLQAQGSILASEVKEQRVVDQGKEGQSTFSPLVRYQYACNGRSYTGIRVSYTNDDYSRTRAEQIVSRYSPGSSVTVYYDPLHPSEAVLEKDTNSYNSTRTTGLILLVLGLGSTCIATMVFLLEKTFQ